MLLFYLLHLFTQSFLLFVSCAITLALFVSFEEPTMFCHKGITRQDRDSRPGAAANDSLNSMIDLATLQ